MELIYAYYLDDRGYREVIGGRHIKADENPSIRFKLDGNRIVVVAAGEKILEIPIPSHTLKAYVRKHPEFDPDAFGPCVVMRVGEHTVCLAAIESWQGLDLYYGQDGECEEDCSIGMFRKVEASYIIDLFNKFFSF